MCLAYGFYQNKAFVEFVSQLMAGGGKRIIETAKMAYF